jgi:hypothetical protein
MLSIGFAIAFFGNWIISLAMLPNVVLFRAPAMSCLQKGNKTGAAVFAMLNTIYVLVLISAWCLGALLLFASISHVKSKIPITLWAYGAATAPWTHLAQKDQHSGGNEFSTVIVLFAQIAFIISGLSAIFANASLRTIIAIFIAMMACSLLVQTILAIIAHKRESIP